MKKVFFIFVLFVFITIPAVTFAGVPGIDLDAALGGWIQGPSGELSYGENLTSEDILDLEDDLDYESITSITGRVKVKFPVIPGIYLVAAPMEFDSDALLGSTFTFGDIDFDPSDAIYSKVTLNQYDIGLFIPLPLLSLATMGKLNIDIGLNGRIMDLEAEVKGTNDATDLKATVTKDVQTVVPLVYLGAKLEPIEKLAFEAELRGITYSDNTLVSIMARLKLKLLGPAYGAAGFRYDSIKIEDDNIEIETAFSGPFLEVGFSL